MMNKIQTKNLLLSVLVFLTGMLSVSISNIFGGYYGSVVAIVTILATFYVYNLFDNKESFKENLPSLILVGVVVALEVLFFIVNDMFGHDVYVKNHLDFWGICVLVSQGICVCGIVYLFVTTLLTAKASKVEIVNEREVNDQTATSDNHDTIDVQTENNHDAKKEIKSIPENATVVNTPFMEEEK